MWRSEKVIAICIYDWDDDDEEELKASRDERGQEIWVEDMLGNTRVLR